MPRQLGCRGMCKIVTWLDQYFLWKSYVYFLFIFFLEILEYELINSL